MVSNMIIKSNNDLNRKDEGGFPQAHKSQLYAGFSIIRYNQDATASCID